MNFQEPHRVYTAAGNVEAHLIVRMLAASGVEAFADEDQSGVSLWAFGRISQFHQPTVWVEKANAPHAAELIREFEEKQRARAAVLAAGQPVEVVCDDCGKESTFPSEQTGTTQQCPHCYSFVDVGESDWDDDYGEPEE